MRLVVLTAELPLESSAETVETEIAATPGLHSNSDCRERRRIIRVCDETATRPGAARKADTGQALIKLIEFQLECSNPAIAPGSRAARVK